MQPGMSLFAKPCRMKQFYSMFGIQLREACVPSWRPCNRAPESSPSHQQHQQRPQPPNFQCQKRERRKKWRCWLPCSTAAALLQRRPTLFTSSWMAVCLRGGGGGSGGYGNRLPYSPPPSLSLPCLPPSLARIVILSICRGRGGSEHHCSPSLQPSLPSDLNWRCQVGSGGDAKSQATNLRPRIMGLTA